MSNSETLGTVGQEAPLSMGFSRQNTGVGCFPTQGSDLRLLCPLNWHVGSSPLVPLEELIVCVYIHIYIIYN